MWTWTSKRPLRLIDPSAGSRQQSRIIISCSKFNWNGRLVFLLLLPCLWCLPLMDHTFVIHTFYSKVAHGADCQDNLSLDLGIPTTIFLPQYLEIIWYLNPRGLSKKWILFLPLVICLALTAAQCHWRCTWPGKEHWKSGDDRNMSTFCTAKFLWLWKWWIGPIFYTELQHIKYRPWCLKWSGIQISWMEGGGDRVAEVFVVLSQL